MPERIGEQKSGERKQEKRTVPVHVQTPEEKLKEQVRLSTRESITKAYLEALGNVFSGK